MVKILAYLGYSSSACHFDTLAKPTEFASYRYAAGKGALKLTSCTLERPQRGDIQTYSTWKAEKSTCLYR